VHNHGIFYAPIRSNHDTPPATSDHRTLPASFPSFERFSHLGENASQSRVCDLVVALHVLGNDDNGKLKNAKFHSVFFFFGVGFLGFDGLEFGTECLWLGWMTCVEIVDRGRSCFRLSKPLTLFLLSTKVSAT